MVLFIGGPKDGCLIDARKHVEDFMQIEPLGGMISAESTVFDNPTQGENIKYVRMQLRGGSEIFQVYVLDGMDCDSVMCKLIENYNPPGDGNAKKL